MCSRDWSDAAECLAAGRVAQVAQPDQTAQPDPESMPITRAEHGELLDRLAEVERKVGELGAVY